MPTATDDRLTTGAVARRLKVSEMRVRQLANTGVLPYERTPLGRLFHPAAIDAYAQIRAERTSVDPAPAA